MGLSICTAQVQLQIRNHVDPSLILFLSLKLETFLAHRVCSWAVKPHLSLNCCVLITQTAAVEVAADKTVASSVNQTAIAKGSETVAAAIQVVNTYTANAKSVEVWVPILIFGSTNKAISIILFSMLTGCHNTDN